MTIPQTSSSKFPLLPLVFTIVTVAISGWWFFGDHSVPCDPETAESRLVTFSAQGIQRAHYPPSLSNLLWVTVGPEWHALSKEDKKAIDRIVRCVATTIDDFGEPTWQAAYYDGQSGKLVALTSKKYGFRLEMPPTE